MQTYYSNGKLLLTGEYVVLDGALSLALPTQFGQSLKIEFVNEPKLIWKSIDANGNVWFRDEYVIQNGTLHKSSNGIQSDNEISNRLSEILTAAKQLNPKFLSDSNGYYVESKLTFPRDWGLGSSSTLVNNIAQWANVDPYLLLELTFGGSGYDIACANYDAAISYQLTKPFDNTQNQKRHICQVDFCPEFKDCLYFVYLNKKQNSREGIEHYKKNRSQISNEISAINQITSKIIDCKALNEFEALIDHHESIISKILQIEPIKNQIFKDFKGSTKSLGAWGGDFILATSMKNPTDYFKGKGYETVIAFEKMVLK